MVTVIICHTWHARSYIETWCVLPWRLQLINNPGHYRLIMHGAMCKTVICTMVLSRCNIKMDMVSKNCGFCEGRNVKRGPNSATVCHRACTSFKLYFCLHKMKDMAVYATTVQWTLRACVYPNWGHLDCSVTGRGVPPERQTIILSAKFHRGK